MRQPNNFTRIIYMTVDQLAKVLEYIKRSSLPEGFDFEAWLASCEPLPEMEESNE